MQMRLKRSQEFLDMANREDICAMDFLFFCLRGYNYEHMNGVGHLPGNRMRISIGNLFLLYFHCSGRPSRTRCISRQHGANYLLYIRLYGQESDHLQPLQGLYSGSNPPDLRTIDLKVNEQNSIQLEHSPEVHLFQPINQPAIINTHPREVSRHVFPAFVEESLDSYGKVQCPYTLAHHGQKHSFNRLLSSGQHGLHLI